MSKILTVALSVLTYSCIVTQPSNDREKGSTNTINIYEGLINEGIRGGGAGNKPDGDINSYYNLMNGTPTPFNINELHKAINKEITTASSYNPDSNLFGSNARENFVHHSTEILSTIDFPVRYSNSRVSSNSSEFFRINIEIIGGEGSCIGNAQATPSSSRIKLECILYHNGYKLIVEGNAR